MSVLKNHFWEAIFWGSGVALDIQKNILRKIYNQKKVLDFYKDFRSDFEPQAILLKLLPQARHLSAFWSGFWLKIFIITIIQNKNPYKNTQQLCFASFGLAFGLAIS